MLLQYADIISMALFKTAVTPVRLQKTKLTRQMQLSSHFIRVEWLIPSICIVIATTTFLDENTYSLHFPVVRGILNATVLTIC